MWCSAGCQASMLICSLQSDKGLYSNLLFSKSLFTVAKAPAPLVQISDYRPQTKGETTSPRFCSLVCSYCPVCKKIKLPSLRYIHHLTFLARVGSVRWVCRDLEEFFWSSANSVLKRHQEKPPLIFFFFSLFWLLLNVCTESRQGVLPVGAVSIVPLKMERVKTDCFSGSEAEKQAPKSLQQLSLPPFLRCFVRSLVCFSTKALPAFFYWRRLRSGN